MEEAVVVVLVVVLVGCTARAGAGACSATAGTGADATTSGRTAKGSSALQRGLLAPPPPPPPPPLPSPWQPSHEDPPPHVRSRFRSGRLAKPAAGTRQNGQCTSCSLQPAQIKPPCPHTLNRESCAFILQPSKQISQVQSSLRASVLSIALVLVLDGKPMPPSLSNSARSASIASVATAGSAATMAAKFVVVDDVAEAESISLKKGKRSSSERSNRLSASTPLLNGARLGRAAAPVSAPSLFCWV